MRNDENAAKKQRMDDKMLKEQIAASECNPVLLKAVGDLRMRLEGTQPALQSPSSQSFRNAFDNGSGTPVSTQQNVISHPISIIGGIGNAVPVGQITLSTHKVFKFRTFTLWLELNSAYVRQHGLTEEDIINAGVNAKCFKESQPDQELLYCSHCCPSKKIIEIASTTKAALGPRKNTNGTEIYTFDACRTHCSSSRDHHKSHFLIVIDGLPNCGSITSMPFSVQAREKGAKKNKGDNSIPPTTLSGTRSGPIAILQPAVPLSTAVALSQQQQQQQQHLQESSSSSSSSSPSIRDSSFESSMNSSLQQGEPKVKVALVTSSLNTVDLDRMVQHFKVFLSKMPGFIQFKYSLLPGMVVAFLFFDSVENHAACAPLLRNYLRNTNGMQNLFNTDLVSSGICVLLAVCNSW
eukprot:TRINITY_DN2471_c0_g1_i1.p1 TRINITY_DN2471_c0_g1~~TRINITY_DN2471_c0_g1_i1.p1  ORF type:complete len:408 (-),score=110.53 TRINITY_DN2471_c0_g1_i1:83-1306(-)